MVNSDLYFLFEKLKQGSLKKLVVANGVDSHSLKAVFRAVGLGIINATITGDRASIVATCLKMGEDSGKITIVDAIDDQEAIEKAVELVREGEAELIMKGLVSTDMYMKAILNKERGLLPKNSLLTHISLIKNPNYHKPLLVSDVAIIPLPTLEQKITMTEYLIRYAHKLGIQQPKVAFLAATEKVIEKMPASTEAHQLMLMWKDNRFPDSICDGPMALDVAIDKDAAEVKQIESEVAGDADCLLFPNIEAGNVFYKANTKLCESTIAAIVAGTSVPIVLSSRGDSTETKLNSIALAALLG